MKLLTININSYHQLRNLLFALPEDYFMKQI